MARIRIELPAAMAKIKSSQANLSLLKGSEASFLYNNLVVDLVPVEHILIDNNPETA